MIGECASAHYGALIHLFFYSMIFRRLPVALGLLTAGITCTLSTLPMLAQQESTPVDRLNVKDGFHVERLYSVPKEQQGSWVAMCVDDRGRLIVSDQYGALYRMTPPAAGQTLKPEEVEKIDVDMGGAQGLLYAFDSLYVVTNTNEHGGRGLYRIVDTDGDDRFDKVERLKKFEEQGGEHGPHAVILGPDGKSLYIICGNQTALPEHDHSRVPPRWQEDQLLPRIYGRGFMKGIEAPRGWVAKTDPDGHGWEIIATGFRNEYDAAFNKDGELFTFDADMEWDVNTPWYRPTRVCHVVSGAEFGWRNGSGKWPAYYTDSVPATVDIGPGSPTGVCFGTSAKFPQKYQDALFIMDWSYGKLYAVHLSPDGASYTGSFEEFISAQPLPLTDIAINPKDGAMYFTVGGRRTQSGVYRVTYTGATDAYPVEEEKSNAAERAQRLALESMHGRDAKADLDVIWLQLGSSDRFLQYAARVALEHQPVDNWIDRVWNEKNPRAKIAALVALARSGTSAHQLQAVNALTDLDYAALSAPLRLDFLRALSLTFIRLGEPGDSQKQAVTAHLNAHLPAATPAENHELLQLLVYLQASDAAAKGVALLESAPSQEEQINYGKSLRLLHTGWSPDLDARYFKWLNRARTYQGGASFGNFVNSIREDAVARLNDAQKTVLKDILDAPMENTGPQFTFKPLKFEKNYSVADFDDVINVGLEGGRNFDNGRNLFGAATCFACHRFNQEGGALGPDLTSVSGKFSPRDLLESIIEPSKEISDQYNSVVVTLDDGAITTGRVVNLNGDTLNLQENMMVPNVLTNIDASKVTSIEPSTISMMPPGLINTLTKDDVLDLMAYLLSAGKADDPMFE
ncbi:MAG: putative heme-binding domain-containing protein [Verrucomicrobiales bacterium]